MKTAKEYIEAKNMKHMTDEKIEKWQGVFEKFNQNGVIEPKYSKEELRTVLAHVLENQSRLVDKEPDFGNIAVRVLSSRQP